MTTQKRITLYITLVVLAISLSYIQVRGQDGGSQSGTERMIRQIEMLFPSTEGYVVSIEGDEILLDLKQGEPVKPGDRLKLIRFGKEIIHPVTKKKIGRAETDVGEVEILEVRRNFTRAALVDKSVKAQVGDGVRSYFKKIGIVIAPVKIETKKKIDADRLRLDLEKALNETTRFQVPAIDLKLWLLEKGLNTEKLLNRENLAQLREKVTADYVLIPSVRSVKKKTVLDYQLFSTLDGTLKNRSQVLSEEVPLLPKVTQKGRRQPGTQESFIDSKGTLEYAGRHTFAYEIVDLDVGDLNGDGEKELVIIDRYRVMVYKYEKGQFRQIARTHMKENLDGFLSVDVGDINGNGRDEIFVTNKHLDRLSSFVLEVEQNKFRKIWKDVNLYFRIIRPFGSKPKLLAQESGYNSPFSGDVKTIVYQNGRYRQGPKVKIPPKYRLPFIVYGLNLTNIDSNENIETIILDKDYHLRVYSASGRLLVKSDEYFGHDPRLINIGVKEDITGVVKEGEPEHVRGRLLFEENGDKRFLLLPKNHRPGGIKLSKMVIVNNSNLVMLRLDKDGFVKVLETKKQKGYLAAFQVMENPIDKTKMIHIATVDAGGLLKKTISTIFTYKWLK